MDFWLTLPDPIRAGLLTLIIIVISWVLIVVGRLFLRKLLKNWLHLHIFYPTIKGIWKSIVIITAFSTFLKYVVHISASTLLAAIGISGVTLGVAAQGFIKDLLMGFVILVTRNFQIGDTITVKGSVTGRVDKITLQNTRLISEDGTTHIIANSEMSIVSIKN